MTTASTLGRNAVGHPQLLSKDDATRRNYERISLTPLLELVWRATEKALSLSSLIQHKLHILCYKTYKFII